MLYETFEKIYALERAGKKIIKLNVGEPDWKPPKSAVKAACLGMKTGAGIYGSSAGESPLREELARLHGCKKENVVITPGSKFGIYSLLKILLRNGDAALSFSPNWTAYGLMCNSLGANLKLIETRQEEGWKANLAGLEAAIDANTKIILLNSPGNPTSVALLPKEEEELISIAKSKGIAVLADDAYRDLCFDARKERQFDGHTLIAGTFSKTFGMTGWRIGYAIAPEEMIVKMAEMHRITITNVPVFLQSAALSALLQKEKIARRARRLCKKRAKLAFGMLGSKLQCVKPNAGFYMFPRLPEGTETGKFLDSLLEKGVAIAPGGAFGNYKNHVRISLCREEEALKEAFEKINSAL